MVGGTFIGLVRVRGQSDRQAESNSWGASCDQHHLLLHVARQAAELHWTVAEKEIWCEVKHSHRFQGQLISKHPLYQPPDPPPRPFPRPWCWVSILSISSVVNSHYRMNPQFSPNANFLWCVVCEFGTVAFFKINTRWQHIIIRNIRFWS